MRDRSSPDQNPTVDQMNDTQQTTSDNNSLIQNESTPAENQAPPNSEIAATNNIRTPPNITEDTSCMNNLGKQSLRLKDNISRSKKESYSLSKWKFGDNINKTINKAQIPYPPDWEAIDSFETVGEIKRDEAAIRYRQRRRNMIFCMVGLLLILAIIACAVGVVLDFHLGNRRQPFGSHDNGEFPITDDGNGNDDPAITVGSHDTTGTHDQGGNDGTIDPLTTLDSTPGQATELQTVTTSKTDLPAMLTNTTLRPST